MFIGSLDLTLFLSNIELPISLGLVYWILTIIPFIALMFRRLHDIGKSALWLFVILIPLIGLFIHLYFMMKAGDKEKNRYGEDPLSNGSFQPKPVGALTVISIFVLLIISNIAYIILVLGVSLTTLVLGLQSEVDNYMQVEQDVSTSKSIITIDNKTTTDNSISIKVPLIQKYELKYSNIKLCTPDDKKDDHFFPKVVVDNYTNSSSCMNDICEVSINIDDPTKYPSDVQMWIEDSNGECKKKKMPAKAPTKAGFSAKIKLTPTLLKRIDITDDNYVVSSKNTDNSGSFKINGVNVIQFEYSEKLSSDTLLVNNEPKITIIFDKKVSIKKPTINPLEEVKRLKKEIVELKKRRDILKKQAQEK